MRLSESIYTYDYYFDIRLGRRVVSVKLAVENGQRWVMQLQPLTVKPSA